MISGGGMAAPAGSVPAVCRFAAVEAGHDTVSKFDMAGVGPHKAMRSILQAILGWAAVGHEPPCLQSSSCLALVFSII